VPACLRAIDEQDYPMERVEVVLVDDHSTDRTEQLGLDYMRVMHQGKPPVNLTTRQPVLDLGFPAARGEIVLLANANSGVPHDWIRELTGHLSYRDGDGLSRGLDRWTASGNIHCSVGAIEMAGRPVSSAETSRSGARHGTRLGDFPRSGSH
jgi:hypothetical protein